mmetsp:Transcript_40524/g.107260  ORF Transcript_40524/g.107260 Transcript_40524/m.107260 type:complete len:115 (+) Transcript_40524:326-670(+)
MCPPIPVTQKRSPRRRRIVVAPPRAAPLSDVKDRSCVSQRLLLPKDEAQRKHVRASPVQLPAHACCQATEVDETATGAASFGDFEEVIARHSAAVCAAFMITAMPSRIAKSTAR